MSAAAAAPSPVAKFTPTPALATRCNSADDLLLLRKQLREYGVQNLQADLHQAGWLTEDASSKEFILATDVKPFNPFARIVSGQMSTPYGNHLQRLGMDADEKFFVAQNRPELDEKWASADAEWLGKASMAQRHQFLLLRSLRWSTFNVLTFGLESPQAGESAVAPLRRALALIDELEAVAREYTQKAGWGPSLGLFVHCYPLNSVQALHIHMLDLDTTGPTFDHYQYKNMPLGEVRKAIQQEIEQREREEQEAEAIKQQQQGQVPVKAPFRVPIEVTSQD